MIARALERRPRDKIKVLVFPKDENPYQQLLYERMPRDVAIKYLDIAVRDKLSTILFFPKLLVRIFIYRLSGYKVIHIHWLSALSLNKNIPFSKQISYYYCRIFILCLKILGYRLVWTVHNVLPHEEKTANDIKLTQYLAKASQAKIVHSTSTINHMRKLNIDVSNCSVIPHGNYIEVYPSITSRQSARKALQIKKDECVILFFGLIRPYKGLEMLLKAYTRLRSPNVRLIIVGKCLDPVIGDEIYLAQSHATIDYYEGHVPDDQVSKYFQACDVVCLPFRTITTSGSALLALSFGKPIIAPRTGALLDLPTNIGYLYSPRKKDALLKGLEHMIDNKVNLNKYGTFAKEYAQTISWDKIAQQTYNVYEGVLN